MSMIIRKGIINSKELQAVAGNWGKPRKEEHSPRRVAEQPEIARHRSKRTKRRIKIDWEARRYGCPFCGKVLQVVLRSKFWFYDKRAKKCHFCFARHRIKGCPACKGDIWYSKGVYKHWNFGCGFTGKKLELKETREIKADPEFMREIQKGLKALRKGKARKYYSVSKLFKS